jgi:hypothetical protein
VFPISDLPPHVFAAQWRGKLSYIAELALTTADRLPIDEWCQLPSCSRQQSDSIRSAIVSAKKQGRIRPPFQVVERIERDDNGNSVKPLAWTVFLINWADENRGLPPNMRNTNS